jgi:lysophospholipase L1-like esterase
MFRLLLLGVRCALAVLALGVMLTACADGDANSTATDEPIPTPAATPSTSPTPSATPTPTATATPTRAADAGTYLALGDSLAVGAGASRPDETGYVALVARALSEDGAVPAVTTLRNLAIGGETSASMQAGQLDDAVRVIEEADPPISLVTLDIGGNDLLALLRTPECANEPQGPPCLSMLAATLATFEQRYRDIMERLTDALAEHAPAARLAVMTYFNPFSGTDAQYEAAGELALVGTDARLDCDATAREARGMNDVIWCIGEELGAITVDVQPRFAGLGLELTHIGAQDIHANDEGYAVIADQFLAALREVE